MKTVDSWIRFRFKQFGYTLFFYKSVCQVTLSISVLCLWVFAAHGPASLKAILWFKVITFGVVVFHVENTRKQAFWYFYNLGLTREMLWIGVVFIDFSIFFGLLTLWHQYV